MTEGKLEIVDGEHHHFLDFDDKILIIQDIDDEIGHLAFCYGDGKAHAKELVRRWNSHQALLGACEASLVELSLWVLADECDCPPEGHLCGLPRLKASMAKIEAAIKQAREDQC